MDAAIFVSAERLRDGHSSASLASSGARALSAIFVQLFRGHDTSCNGQGYDVAASTFSRITAASSLDSKSDVHTCDANAVESTGGCSAALQHSDSRSMRRLRWALALGHRRPSTHARLMTLMTRVTQRCGGAVGRDDLGRASALITMSPKAADHVPVGLPVAHATPYTDQSAGHFADGLCACANDPKLSLAACCCPAVTIAQVWERIMPADRCGAFWPVFIILSVCSLVAASFSAGCPQAQVVCDMDKHGMPVDCKSTMAVEPPAVCELVSSVQAIGMGISIALLVVVRCGLTTPRPLFYSLAFFLPRLFSALFFFPCRIHG